MSMYDAKDDSVRRRAQEVQRLSIPLSIAHNATPASKVASSDEPGILFMNVQGIVGISVANGSLTPVEVPPALATATDSTGVINVQVLIREPLIKVMNVMLVSRDAGGVLVSGQILPFSTGANGFRPPGAPYQPQSPDDTIGESIFANITTGVNLSTTDLNACLIVEYITSF
jgi:hypothetical protein